MGDKTIRAVRVCCACQSPFPQIVHAADIGSSAAGEQHAAALGINRSARAAGASV